MAGYYGTPQHTEDRERKILELKKKIIKMYGSSIINFLSYQTPFPVIHRDDTLEEKKAKQEEIQFIIKEREQEYLERENELLDELNKLMARISNKTDHGNDPNGNDFFYTSSFVAADNGVQILCPKCGNKDINHTIFDPIRGDLTCNGKEDEGCGEVLEDSTFHTGAEKRNFEGEENRNHHGPSPNKLMPDVVNLETSLNVSLNGRDSSEFKRMAYAHQKLEMDLSKIDKDEKHTRLGYKAKMKRKAFALLEEIGGNLNLHKLVIEQAKEQFAKYRDMKEAVHKFEGTVAACLVLAYEDLSKSMQLDEINKTYNVISDIANLDSSFGNLPSHEEVKDDIAICTIPNINIGNFTIQQVKEWIDAISQHGNQQKISKHKPTIAQIYIDFQFYGNILFHSIEEELEKEKELLLKKKKTANAVAAAEQEHRSRENSVVSHESTAATPMDVSSHHGASAHHSSSSSSNSVSFFGHTTMAQRMQSFAASSTHNGGTEGIPAGKLLLRIVPKEVIKQKLVNGGGNQSTPPSSQQPPQQQLLPTNNVFYDENDVKIVSDYFKEAIQRRSSYDKLMMEKTHEKQLEQRRIKIEESLSITRKKKLAKEYHPNGLHEEQQQEEEEIKSDTKKRKTETGAIAVGGVNESKGNNNNTNHAKILSERDREQDEVKIEFLDEINLEDLIGGMITTIKPTTKSNNLTSVSNNAPKSILKKVTNSAATPSSSSSSSIPAVKLSPSSGSSITVKIEKKDPQSTPAVKIETTTTKIMPAVQVKTEIVPSSHSSMDVVSDPPAPVLGDALSSTVDASTTHAHGSHTAAPSHPRKVGMKPRPKIVIS